MTTFLSWKILYILIAFLLVGSFSILQTRSIPIAQLQPREQQKEFDYFLLSLLWPATQCRRTSHCCSSNACCLGSKTPTQFTIHGLWTDYNDGTWPACCTNSKFEKKKLYVARQILKFSKTTDNFCNKEADQGVVTSNQPSFDLNLPAPEEDPLDQIENLPNISCLLDDLNKYWPTYTCDKYSTCNSGDGLFWAHEWEKHGTCAFPVIRDEYSYFTTTLDVFFKHNVTTVLNEAGYVPSDSEKYPLGGIISALQNAFHATPLLVCSEGAIDELRLCFYKDFKPRDCSVNGTTSSSDGSCPQYVSLPLHASLGSKEGKTPISWLPHNESF